MTDPQDSGSMTRFLPEELIFYKKESPTQCYRCLGKQRFAQASDPASKWYHLRKQQVIVA